MLDENLIATLEQSLRQTRNAQNRLLVRLREVESESERLRQEIEALENSACQTEAAIFSLLATMRAGNQTWNLGARQQNDEDYDLPQDIQRQKRNLSNNQQQMQQNNQQNNNYRPSNLVAYINKNRNVPLVSSRSEPISNRFSDRTITQACTLLLREAGSSLHVNELYNLLVSGGMEFTGNNPTISIAVSLNRNRRFRKVAPGTFDLVMRDASQSAS
jgi:hypothetical protein